MSVYNKAVAGGGECPSAAVCFKSLYENSKNECLVRIICIELESWCFGDLKAVSSQKHKNCDKMALLTEWIVRLPILLNIKDALMHHNKCDTCKKLMFAEVYVS